MRIPRIQEEEEEEAVWEEDDDEVRTEDTHDEDVLRQQNLFFDEEGLNQQNLFSLTTHPEDVLQQQNLFSVTTHPEEVLQQQNLFPAQPSTNIQQQDEEVPHFQVEGSLTRSRSRNLSNLVFYQL